KTCRVATDAVDLSLRGGCGACPHSRGVRAVERAAPRRHLRLGAGVRRLCGYLRLTPAGSLVHADGAAVISGGATISLRSLSRFGERVGVRAIQNHRETLTPHPPPPPNGRGSRSSLLPVDIKRHDSGHSGTALGIPHKRTC